MADSRPERRARFHAPGDSNRLHFASRKLSPVRNIAVRVAIALLALFVTAVLVYAEGDCYSDRGELGNMSWIDAFYYSAVTLSTTGYGDITPVCESARLVNILVITPLRFLFLIVLVGTTIEVLTQRSREEFRATRWRKHVQDHTMIIGYGVKGRAAAASLLDGGAAPSSIVVVTPDRSDVDEATRRGMVGVIGDARREEVLRDAAIDRAARIIIAPNEDDTAVLITLTARRLAPQARIVVAVRQGQNAEVLRQSGADIVIPTAESAGRMMGLALRSPTAGQLLEDLMDAGRGLEITERAITREELGLSPSDIDSRGQIVLAVIRNGEVFRFDQEGVAILQQGDRLVVIQHNDLASR